MNSQDFYTSVLPYFYSHKKISTTDLTFFLIFLSIKLLQMNSGKVRLFYKISTNLVFLYKLVKITQ